MDDRKYIIVEELGCEVAILFNELIVHSTFVKAYCKERIVSAGFFRVEIKNKELSVSVYGESATLKRKSRPEDSIIIKRMLSNDW